MQPLTDYIIVMLTLSSAHLKCSPLVLSWCVLLIITTIIPHSSLQVSLNLSNNRLEHLPSDLGCLTGLEELFLQYNRLTTLPVSMVYYATLQCVLAHAQESLGLCTRLVELDVKNNLLTHLPGKMEDRYLPVVPIPPCAYISQWCLYLPVVHIPPSGAYTSQCSLYLPVVPIPPCAYISQWCLYLPVPIIISQWCLYLPVPISPSGAYISLCLYLPVVPISPCGYTSQWCLYLPVVPIPPSVVPIPPCAYISQWCLYLPVAIPPSGAYISPNHYRWCGRIACVAHSEPHQQLSKGLTS